MIQLFAGYDVREAIGYHVFCQSIIDNTTEPVNIAPLSLSMLDKVYNGGSRDGTNQFIYSRFLIPYLCGYRGSAIFMDGSDMLCRGDIAELWAMRDPYKAVQVVKHKYKTKHPRKYVGTAIEADNHDYPMKNSSSVMIMNFSHYAWRNITPDVVAKVPGRYLHRFEFIEDRYVGELPIEWNWLSQEYGENPDAKLIHYSIGIPAFPNYRDTPMAADWLEVQKRVNYATS